MLVAYATEARLVVDDSHPYIQHTRGCYVRNWRLRGRPQTAEIGRLPNDRSISETAAIDAFIPKADRWENRIFDIPPDESSSRLPRLGHMDRRPLPGSGDVLASVFYWVLWARSDLRALRQLEGTFGRVAFSQEVLSASGRIGAPEKSGRVLDVPESQCRDLDPVRDAIAASRKGRVTTWRGGAKRYLCES